MINFRYHVVSLTAVFLALAIGLVVGTAALNGPLADQLNDRVNGVSNQNKQLREQVASMEEEVNRQEDFAKQAAPHLLTGTLEGRRVAVVSLPAANKYADGVVEMLTLAGATVTSRLDIQDKLTLPDQNVDLLDLSYEAMPTTVTSLPRNSDGVETASALLATVMLDRKSSTLTGTEQADDRTEVFAAFKEKGFLSVVGDVTGGADAIVVIAGTPTVDRDAAKRNAAVVTLVEQFDAAGPVVLAGNGVAGEGNAVADVRGDPALNKTISTVDNVYTAQGRIATVLALVEQLRPASKGGTQKAGHYGIDAGTLLPELPK